ncbi:hypothetical protein [Marinicellulosiphila megalodicopiae]|uniref:hypothetical protein n=1 Tax=Marinicellulosiphila megalodicopiae TaxID=2724896 RepID=UPI003BB2201D
MLNSLRDQESLIEEVKSLCIFNDKGWGGDTSSPSAIEMETDKKMEKIQNLMSAVGICALPEKFINAVESGLVRNDVGGEYYRCLISHFNKPENSDT